MTLDLIDRHLMTLFLEDARGKAIAIESGLLELEKAQKAPEREEALLGLLRTVHSLKGAAGFVEMRVIEQASHWLEDVFIQLSGGTKEITKDVLTRLFQVTDALITTVRSPLYDVVDETPILTALAGSNEVKQYLEPFVAPALPARSQGDESTRVSLSKLDALLYRSAELVRAKDRLLKRRNDASDLYDMVLSDGVHGSSSTQDHLLSKILELVDNLDQDYINLKKALSFLEGDVRSARNQSFQVACVGLARVVRDACENSGKLVSLNIDGERLEIDQSIIQSINDILRHLVRNAVDHGIESPEDRLAQGKAPRGTISVSFKVTGNKLRVEVRDDGQGVSLLRETVDPAHELENDVILRKLFQPGYSTAGNVTKLSGRGFGLDIVKETVEGLRGYLEVALNDEGGMTFTIVLPLSLAITRGLIFNACDQSFAIETIAARRLTKCNSERIVRDGEKTRIIDGDREIPAVFITKFLYGEFCDPSENGEYDAVIIGEEGREVAVLVNSISEEQEIVIKPLGKRVSVSGKYNGAATLSSGEMILVINPVALQKSALGNEETGLIVAI